MSDNNDNAMDISPPTPRTSNVEGEGLPSSPAAAPPSPPNQETTTSNNNNNSSSSTTELPSNRFELELEFIQCLASPAYLHHLATSNILSSPSFLAYLKYLRYWKQPEYVRFIIYPHCLYFLDLLIENETFRREMGNVGFRNFVHEQQFYSWQYRAERLYGRGCAKKMEESLQQQQQAEMTADGMAVANAADGGVGANGEETTGQTVDSRMSLESSSGIPL